MGRSPREDKDRDYSRRSVSGSAHGFRKHWPKRKATLHRRSRRAASTALAQAGALPIDGVVDGATDGVIDSFADEIADTIETRVATTRRWRDPNTNRSPLGVAVTWTLARRFFDMVDTYSAGPYRPETQRLRTVAALTEVTRHRPFGDSTRVTVIGVAFGLNELLPDPVLPTRRTPGEKGERWREWFAAFLADVPEWETRLARWIADHGARRY